MSSHFLLTIETKAISAPCAKTGTFEGTEQGLQSSLQPNCPVGRIGTGGVLEYTHPLSFTCQIFPICRYAQILKNFSLFVCGLQKCVIKTTLSLANSQSVSPNTELFFWLCFFYWVPWHSRQFYDMHQILQFIWWSSLHFCLIWS